jgi:calcineurin-like phosphoesterase family protein
VGHSKRWPVAKWLVSLLALAVALAIVGLALLFKPRLGGEQVGSTVAPTQSAAPVSASTSPTPSSSAGEETTLLAVGDIGYCNASNDDHVGQLAARLPGTIALLGDIAYEAGTAKDYANCFNPAWGSLLDRLRPVPGNHDYETKGAAGYFSYFGAAAGTAGQGWYSYDLAAWHVIALNSECGAIEGGCGKESVELDWLRADLAAHPARCTLAYWHHPRYSSGLHGDNDMTDGLWQALATAGADVVLEGHDHDYERMAPIDGLRSFVVGTGGRSLYEWPGSPGPYTEVRANDTYGLLELTLRPADFTWRFIPAAGGSFTDSGEAACH